MKQDKRTQACLIILITVLSIFSLSGCTTTTQPTQKNPFTGTWVGTMEMPLFGGRNNTSVSQITFTDDHAEMLLTTDQGSFPMNYSYTVNGNTVVFEPLRMNRGGFSGRMPFNGTERPNGTRQPGNGTWQPNGTMPFNRTGSFNWTRPPGGTQPSMTLSFVYSFNEEDTELSLNDAQFIRT
jgi:hypothetical protein